MPQSNPFEEFGGQEVTTSSQDPFADFGGKIIPVKKKEGTALSTDSVSPLSPPTTVSSTPITGEEKSTEGENQIAEILKSFGTPTGTLPIQAEDIYSNIPANAPLTLPTQEQKAQVSKEYNPNIFVTPEHFPKESQANKFLSNVYSAIDVMPNPYGVIGKIADKAWVGSATMALQGAEQLPKASEDVVNIHDDPAAISEYPAALGKMAFGAAGTIVPQLMAFNSGLGAAEEGAKQLDQKFPDLHANDYLQAITSPISSQLNNHVFIIPTTSGAPAIIPVKNVTAGKQGLAELGDLAYYALMAKGFSDTAFKIRKNEVLTPEDRNNVAESLGNAPQQQAEFKPETLDKIPQDIAPEKKIEIAPLVEEKQNLEAQKETTDDAFHPLIEQKQQELTTQINDIINPSSEQAPELADLKKQEADLTTQAADISTKVVSLQQDLLDSKKPFKESEKLQILLQQQKDIKSHLKQVQDAISKQETTSGVLRNEGLSREGELPRVEQRNQPEVATESSPKTQEEKVTPTEEVKPNEVNKFYDELKNDKNVFWHGSPSGDLRGGTTGLHIGTFKAAKQALEARIGVKADGSEWDGTEEYGKVLLAGKKTLKRIEKEEGRYVETGFNASPDVPQEDYYISQRKERANYSDKSPVSETSKPNIQPVKITGKMTNTPNTPHEDFKANGLMKGALKKGTAKSGYFYKNEGEDYGSISAVVPNAKHIEKIEPPKSELNPPEEGKKENVVAPESKESDDFSAKSGNKAVDKNGEPIVLYHAGQDVLSPIKNDKYTKGRFFTTEKRAAEAFGKKVSSAVVNMKNPFVVDAKGESYSNIATPKAMKDFVISTMKTVDTDLIADFAHKNGYDGVIIKNVLEGGSADMKRDAYGYGVTPPKADNYIVFDKSQIKEVKSESGIVSKEGVSGEKIPVNTKVLIERKEFGIAKKPLKVEGTIVGYDTDSGGNLLYDFRWKDSKGNDRGMLVKPNEIVRTDEKIGKIEPEISPELKAQQVKPTQENAPITKSEIRPPEAKAGEGEKVKEEKKYTEKAKKLADKIRGLKSKPLELKDENGNPLTIEKQGIDLNDVLDKIADAVERGGELADAINDTLKDLKWFQGLTDKGKEAVRQQLSDQFEKGMSGISHAKTEEARKEFGIDEPYQGRTPKSDAELEAEATQQIKDGYNIENLITRLENGEHPNDVETVILKKYKAGLEAKLEKNPSDENLADLRRLVEATDKVGSEQGAAFRQRQGLDFRDDSLSGFFTREQDANKGAPLTDAQKEKVLKEYNDIKEAQKEWDKEKARLENENAKLKAENEIKKAKSGGKPKVKKTHEEYVAERKSLIEQFKEAGKKPIAVDEEGNPLKVETKGISLNNEQVKIIGKYVKSLVDEGIDKLDDVVKHISENLGITKDDTMRAIAGEYSEAKKPRNEITAKLFELKQQAKLTKQLEDLQNGIEPKNEKAKIKRNQEIDALKKQIKEHDLTRLADYKKRTQSQIEKLEQDLKTGNFSKPEKLPPVKLDQAAKEARDKLIKLKQQREVRLMQQEYENRTKYEKARDKILEVLNVPRTLMSSMDFSAPLRQGIVLSLGHLRPAMRAGIEMFRQAFSQKNFDRWFYDVKEHPRYTMSKDAGLYIADPHDPRLTAKEEYFMNNLAEKIPVIGKFVKGSERAYVGYLNKLRWDVFNRFADMYEENGRTFENSPELYKGLADYVNNATGRGKLGPIESAAPVLNSFLFAPRLIASRINLLTNWANPKFYKEVPKEVRKEYFKDMAKFIALGTTVLALTELNGAQVEKDPRSSDFGKIKSGNTRWDIWGGFQPYIRVMAQLLSGQSKSANTQQIQDLSGGGAFGKTRGDVALTFARGKLAPIPSIAADVLAQRTIAGQKPTILNELQSHMLPLLANDITDAVKDKGIQALFTAGIPSTFGVGVQTYLPQGYTKEMKQNPTYKFLYDNHLNITEPTESSVKAKYEEDHKQKMTPEQYKKFSTDRKQIFEKEWTTIVNHGAYINDEGNPTIDKDEMKSRKDANKLTQEELIQLMKSVSSKATRDASKQFEVKKHHHSSQ